MERNEQRKWHCFDCDDNHYTSDGKWHCVSCDVFIKYEEDIKTHIYTTDHFYRSRSFKRINFITQIIEHIRDNFKERIYTDYDRATSRRDRIKILKEIEIGESCKFSCAYLNGFFDKYREDGFMDFIDYKIFIKKMDLDGIYVYYLLDKYIKNRPIIDLDTNDDYRIHIFKIELYKDSIFTDKDGLKNKYNKDCEEEYSEDY